MKRFCIFLLLGFIGVILQTRLVAGLSWLPIRVDLVVILCAYSSITFSPVAVGLLAFSYGTMVDTFSGSLPGLHVLILVVLLVPTAAMAPRIFAPSRHLLLALVGLLSIGTGMLLVIVLGLSQGAWGQIGHLLTYIIPQTLLTMLVSPLVFRLLEKIDGRPQWPGAYARGGR